jgi:tetratricopeptide (TPR) repeat protein
MRCWAILLLVLAACLPQRVEFERAAALLRAGQVAEARRRFVRLSRTREEAGRVRAALGAAQASAILRDAAAQRHWLERAAAPPEVAGLSEEAYFELGEFLRTNGQLADALSYYYRAAAAARRTENRALYERAIRRLAALGAPP